MNYSKKILTSLLISSFAVFPVSAFADDTLPTSSLELAEINVVHQETQRLPIINLLPYYKLLKMLLKKKEIVKQLLQKVLTKLLMITLLSMNNILIFMKSRLMLPQNYGQQIRQILMWKVFQREMLMNLMRLTVLTSLLELDLLGMVQAVE